MLAKEITKPFEEKSAFCVGLLPDGKTLRLTADSPEEFMEGIQRSAIAWVNLGVQSLAADGLTKATLMGFSQALMELLLQERHSAYEDRDTEMGMVLPIVRVEGLEVKTKPLLVLVRRGLILTMHEGPHLRRIVRFARYAEGFLRKIPADYTLQDKTTVILTRLIDENNEGNFDGLRRIEDQGDSISSLLVDSRAPRAKLSQEIYSMKHALITYLDTLWSGLDVIQALRYGDAELITDNPTLLARIGILADEVNRHIQLSEHMSEVMASGLEVLQSIYNNQLQILNNRMSLIITYLTILGTAVLVPNTIATVLGAGVINVGPGDLWWYLILLVVSTVLSTWFAWWFVKRKGWLPPAVE